MVIEKGYIRNQSIWNFTETRGLICKYNAFNASVINIHFEKDKCEMQNELIKKIKALPSVKKYRIHCALKRVAFKYFLSPEDIKKAEKEKSFKLQALDKQATKWPKKNSELLHTIDEIVIANPALSDCRDDMLFCFYAYGFTPHEYACYQFDKKNNEQRKMFVSDRFGVVYGYKFNDPDYFHVFMNKSETYATLKPYYHRDGVEISSEKDFEKFSNFVNKHPVFVKKDNDESCGRGVELVDTLKLKKSVKELFDEYVASGVKFIEEVVEQANKMADLNSSSVNTIRCFTLRLKDETIIPYCFLKVGRGNNFVDNGGAGGILVGIDVKTGQLNSNGVDEDGIWYERHPDSGVRFCDYQLPEWEKMISMCIEAAQVVPQIRLTGWDVAYTNNGWVMIEGNCLSELIGPQSTQSKGIKRELEDFLRDLEL